MKTVWYDVTEIVEWKGHHTGIQRVIYMLGSKLAQDTRFNVRYYRYDLELKRFLEINFQFLEHHYEKPLKKSSVQKRSVFVSIRIIALGFVPRVFKTLAKRAIRRTKRALRRVKPVVFQDSDTVFVPGAFWIGFLPVLEVEKAKHRLRVIGIIYDLVPLLLPQYSPEGTASDYKKNIGKAIRLYDSWLSISENTKNDLIQYAKERKLPLQTDSISIIRLGSDIDISGPVKPLRIKGKTPKDYILCVGTLEPRKNQQLVYQTVKLYMEKGIALPLIIIAGKRGWLSDDLAHMLRHDKVIADKLVWCEEVDDSRLRWLYQNCMFSVYASHYEGWGLPIAESLAYGKFCIASRSSSLTEIAGDKIIYFSSNSPEELGGLLHTYSTDKRLLASATNRAASFTQTTWQETYERVIKYIGV